jgi:hypothetical protein
MTTKKPDDPVAEAEDVLASIGKKTASAVARRDVLIEQMGDLGYAAHGLGDVNAKARIGELSQEVGRIDHELVALGSAQVEGSRRLAAARRDAERDVIRGKAAEALEKVPELRAEGARCGALLHQFLESYARIYAISDSIRKTGVGRWSRDEVFEGTVRRSLMAALPRGLRPEPLITAPAQRKELAEVLERHISELEISLQRELDELEPPEIAEAAQ